MIKTTDLFYYRADETPLSLAQTQLYWVFMTVLQLAHQDELLINQPISFHIPAEQRVITVTRLKDPAPDYWTIKGELFIKERLQGNMEASGYFGEDGMLLFSLTNKEGKSFFGVNDAGEPLVLNSMSFIGNGKKYLHLNADKNQKLNDVSKAEDIPTGNLIEEKYEGDGFTVTIIHKDKSMGRILYKIRIQGEKDKIDFTFVRIE